jgi:hypothetical protein
VADLPQTIDRAVLGRAAAHLDAEGKLPRALDALASIAGRDLVLVDADGGVRARQLAVLGARVTALERADRLDALTDALAGAVPDDAGSPPIRPALGEPTATGLDDASADLVVGCFSAYRGVDEAEQAEADRVLRPGGRLLIVHDYGRDDISTLTDADRPEYGAWGRRDGPFARGGFKLRVIHCWWTFESVEDASELLGAAFGSAGTAFAAGMDRPRLSHNFVVYHRSRGGA